MDLSCFLMRMNYLNDDLKMGSNKPQHTTQYIQNRRDSSKFKGCSPLQSCNGLISLKPAIAYFAYTQRYRQVYGQRPTKWRPEPTIKKRGGSPKAIRVRINYI